MGTYHKNALPSGYQLAEYTIDTVLGQTGERVWRASAVFSVGTDGGSAAAVHAPSASQP